MPAPKVVRIDPEAEEEITAGTGWYEQRQPGLGGDFLDEVSSAINSLHEPGPECTLLRGVPAELGVKRKLVRRFPYLVLFIELERTVRVIAVAHASRRPGYWRRRI
jgi:hypothetical protein